MFTLKNAGLSLIGALTVTAIFWAGGYNFERGLLGGYYVLWCILISVALIFANKKD